jgi:hypothetical protein
VGKEGLMPNPEKTASIDEFQPQNRSDVASFHGMASYYRRFIKGFATIARPLTQYINSRKQWNGVTPEMQGAIDAIKKALTSDPIMAHPDFGLPFEIHCDASPCALGATLVQKIDGVEKVVMFISRTLKKHELNYHREALALVWSCSVFRPYTIGRRFKVVTDNQAVTYLMKKNANSRVIRWVLALQQHQIEYVHRSGAGFQEQVRFLLPSAMKRMMMLTSWPWPKKRIVG